MRFDSHTSFLVSRHAGASWAPKIKTGIAHHLVGVGCTITQNGRRGAVKCTAGTSRTKQNKKGVVFFFLSFQRPMFWGFFFKKKLFLGREKSPICCYIQQMPSVKMNRKEKPQHIKSSLSKPIDTRYRWLFFSFSF